MGRKVKLSSLLIKPREYWPSCTQNPKTVSFRIDDDNIFKTLNSVYFVDGDPAAADESTPDSWFSRHYNYTTSASTASSCPSSRDDQSEPEEEDINAVRSIDDGGRVDSSDHHDPDPDPVEEVIRGAQGRDMSSTRRLFFNPDETSSSLITSTDYVDHRDVLKPKQEVEEEETNVNVINLVNKEKDIIISCTTVNDDEPTVVENYSPPPFQESVVMALESEDPYEDFRRSMEEMVLTHGMIKDWGCLEELLCWYLRVNSKDNHGYIVGAFVDLLVKFSSSDQDDGCIDQDGDHNQLNHNRLSTSTAFSSAASSFCSSNSSTCSCGGAFRSSS